ILLWIVNFMNLLNLYFLASWMPTVVRDAGHSASTAVLAGTVLQVGGTIGTVGLAWLIARLGFVDVPVTPFGLACLAIGASGAAAVPAVISTGAVWSLRFTRLKSLAARGESRASHRDERGAPPARRDD